MTTKERTTRAAGLVDVGCNSSVDADTHEGLRAALRIMIDDGWDSIAGRSVLEALRRRSGSWATTSAARRGLPPGSFDRDDVLWAAWLTLDRCAKNVIVAQAPWAYLWTAVGNMLARDAAAQAVLSERASKQPAGGLPATVLRVGLEARLLDQRLGSDAAEADELDEEQPSVGVATLVSFLAETEVERTFWADAVGRAIDVMADSRHSYEEHRLRRDPYLREELGLSLDELSALGALLIGPRRGDRAAQSLLLALHRDPATRVADVDGAERRIALLRARPHQRFRPAESSAA